MLQGDYLRSIKGYNYGTFNNLRSLARWLIGGPMKNLITLVVMALFALPSFTKADVEDRLYDFTDAYYLENGVNPALISGRMQPAQESPSTTPPTFLSKETCAPC